MAGDNETLVDLLARNRAGERAGIYAVCSAHPLVIEACVEQALADDSPLLVEATCNQVNQDGGYTGMRPADFRAFVLRIAEERGLPAERLILGGDHLGPNPWRKEPAQAAMVKASIMVQAYVLAGFTKIHLDCSMACAGDPEPLPDSVIAERAASLCAVAEVAAARADTHPVYVVGTEVPTPGGAPEAMDRLVVTEADDVERTLQLHREAFARAGIEAAAHRIVAVVVQPGVEFGHGEVVDFVPEAAVDLAAALIGLGPIVYEAHSTDYQTEAALEALVNSHFAILKVGPGLTFALREAVFALTAIEAELLPDAERSGFRDALEAAMLRDPGYWRPYYDGGDEEERRARAYSLSDRSRYYWGDAEVKAALEKLLTNLIAHPAPLPLLSQFMPLQYAAIRSGQLTSDPATLLRHHVRLVAASYARACGFGCI